MKELSPELSAPKGARALSAGVSQSLSKSPIYIKMPFQTCFDFTFPLSSPSPSRPTSQPHCPRSTRRGPSALPAGKEQERKKRAGNEARSRNRSWSRSSGSCDPFSSCLMLGGRPGGRSWPRGMELAVSPPRGQGLAAPATRLRWPQMVSVSFNKSLRQGLREPPSRSVSPAKQRSAHPAPSAEATGGTGRPRQSSGLGHDCTSKR